MQTLTYNNLSRWTTQELLEEVVMRTATDGPGLEVLEAMVIRARLAESDRRFGDATQPELEMSMELTRVVGTMEMGFADGGESSVLTAATHEVDPETVEAHAHDHTHRRVSSTKFAAHMHHHLHLNDEEADAELNGHTHARAHARHPWEPAHPE